MQSSDGQAFLHHRSREPRPLWDDAKSDPRWPLFRLGVNRSCHWTSRHMTITWKKLAIRRSSHVTLLSYGLSTVNWPISHMKICLFLDFLDLRSIVKYFIQIIPQFYWKEEFLDTIIRYFEDNPNYRVVWKITTKCFELNK